MALKIAPKAKATVSTEDKVKGQVINETKKEETVDLTSGGVMVEEAPTATSFGPFAEVGIDASYTHNLGDYKSARVGVSLKVPCMVGEIDEAFAMGEAWVNQKIEKMIADIVG